MIGELRPADRISRAWSFVGILCIGLFLSACGTATDSPPVHTPLDTQVAKTPGQTRTLPPTWTPTFTFTPAPPTPTPTITETPPPTSTRDPARLCQDFEVLAAPDDGVRVGYDERVAFSWQGAPPDMIVRVALLHRVTNEGILVEWDSHQALNMTVDMALLPVSGVYDWTLTLYEFPQGDQCAVEGWFERLTQEESITPTAESSPETPTLAATEVTVTPDKE